MITKNAPTFALAMLATLALETTFENTVEAAKATVGDLANGKLLYQRECASCHGDDGKGGRSGIGLTDSGRMNLIRDEEMFQVIERGAGLKTPKEHDLSAKLAFLDIWDVIAHVRGLHMTLDHFFPDASRYVSKEYTIDEHGLGRIRDYTGKALTDAKAAVFTFFDFDGEKGRLSHVPNVPVQLDQLKKKNKVGHLVFLPLATGEFAGEAGIAMDATGKITKISVHGKAKDAELLNKSLARFVGVGKKGQKDKFKVGGGPAIDKLSEAVFPAFMRAMESATMYDREERERTWAEE